MSGKQLRSHGEGIAAAASGAQQQGKQLGIAEHLGAQRFEAFARSIEHERSTGPGAPSV
jgi:hypothetical protein